MDGEIMPEKMTKEEVVVAQTIDQLRVVKELLKEEKNLREAPETNERVAYDSLGEEVKVKRPKKTGEKDTTKIENNTGTHSGYGLAGQESHFKKSIHPQFIKAFNVGQRQQQAQQDTQKIVDALVADTRYTQRLDKRFEKLVEKDQTGTEYKFKVPLMATLTQKLKFRGQPASVMSMLEEKLAEIYDVEEVKINGNEITFRKPKNTQPQGENTVTEDGA